MTQVLQHFAWAAVAPRLLHGRRRRCQLVPLIPQDEMWDTTIVLSAVLASNESDVRGDLARYSKCQWRMMRRPPQEFVHAYRWLRDQ
jgi:hypothetical protein